MKRDGSDIASSVGRCNEPRQSWLPPSTHVAAESTILEAEPDFQYVATNGESSADTDSNCSKVHIKASDVLYVTLKICCGNVLDCVPDTTPSVAKARSATKDCETNVIVCDAPVTIGDNV